MGGARNWSRASIGDSSWWLSWWCCRYCSDARTVSIRTDEEKEDGCCCRSRVKICFCLVDRFRERVLVTVNRPAVDVTVPALFSLKLCSSSSWKVDSGTFSITSGDGVDDGNGSWGRCLSSPMRSSEASWTTTWGREATENDEDADGGGWNISRHSWIGRFEEAFWCSKSSSSSSSLHMMNLSKER